MHGKLKLASGIHVVVADHLVGEVEGERQQSGKLIEDYKCVAVSDGR